MSTPKKPPPREGYPAAAVGKIIDEALGKSGQRKRQPSADELADWLGDALSRWPDDWGPGERDEVSHVIHVLDTIAERGQPRKRRRA